MLEVMVVKYQGISRNLAKKSTLAGSNSEAIQPITLKLTMDECLKRHYVRTFYVDLTWNDPIYRSWRQIPLSKVFNPANYIVDCSMSAVQEKVESSYIDI